MRKFYVYWFATLLASIFILGIVDSSSANTNYSQGSCAIVYNSRSSGGLAVRVVPSTGGAIIKRIPDNTIVRITGRSITFNGHVWWPHDGGGWSAGGWLKANSCGSKPAYAAANQLNQTVQLNTNGSITAANLTGGTPVKWLDSIHGKLGQFPLAPPVTSMSSMRSQALYRTVIQQFAAGNNNRYVASSGYTYCNTFAGDVMRAMGVPLPIKSASDPATIGAAPLYNWLIAGNGWTRIYPATNAADMTRLINHVNAGKPALAATTGHVAVVRPYQATNTTSFKDLRLAQAGAQNNNNIRLGNVWTTTTPAFFIRN